MSDIEASKLPNAEIRALQQEWDDASCPICMDHPHNAVLLLCSSFDKGCRSYMCDTSYRHSNCLDRFKKPRVGSSGSNTGDVVRNLRRVHGDHRSGQAIATSISSDATRSGNLVNSSTGGVLDGLSQAANEIVMPITECGSCDHLKCPLCRGTVHGWKVVKEAREYLDLKPRSCSRESCSFVGNYHELRRHARRVHPSTHPTDVDPSRQQAWRRLEHQREYGDIVSAIRSAMPGSIVLGDYVLDNDNELPFDGEGATEEAIEPGQWWTTLFLFHMLRPIGRLDEGIRGSSRSWRRYRRSSGGVSNRRRRYPWGERLLDLYEDEDRWNSTGDAGDAFSTPRTRRRLTRPTSDDEQS